jgi:very-short-patch-repair endonuclease
VAVSHLLVVGALLAVGLALAERLARAHRRGVGLWPVYARPVLTEAERGFYAQLRVAVPQFAVLCQVQISRFVEVKDVTHRLEILNRYNRLSADFVICAEDFRPLLVVELDDSSHDRPAQRARDAKKDAVLAAAGVPIVRFRGMVSVDRLREDLSKALRGFDRRSRSVEQVSVTSGRKVPYIGGL